MAQTTKQSQNNHCSYSNAIMSRQSNHNRTTIHDAIMMLPLLGCILLRNDQISKEVLHKEVDRIQR